MKKGSQADMQMNTQSAFAYDKKVIGRATHTTDWAPALMKPVDPLYGT